MCTQSCLEFVTNHLTANEVRDLSVLEVGALDVNGSARSAITGLGPARYIGVDMQDGPGVDEVCTAETLIARYGNNAFDVVISTEMLEHVFDWRVVLHNLKGVVKSNGLLLITTRSFGFGYHAYPFDFWRYELDDMRTLFSDFHIMDLMSDPISPGVYLKARKPQQFVEANLDSHALYSMMTRRRSVVVSEKDIAWFHARRRILEPLRAIERGVRLARKRTLGK